MTELKSFEISGYVTGFVRLSHMNCWSVSCLL